MDESVSACEKNSVDARCRGFVNTRRLAALAQPWAQAQGRPPTNTPQSGSRPDDRQTVLRGPGPRSGAGLQACPRPTATLPLPKLLSRGKLPEFAEAPSTRAHETLRTNSRPRESTTPLLPRRPRLAARAGGGIRAQSASDGSGAQRCRVAQNDPETRDPSMRRGFRARGGWRPLARRFRSGL